MPDESDTAQRGVNPAGTPDAGATSAETVDRPNAPAAVGSIQPGASASRRVRARLARRMTATRSQVRPVLEPLVTLHREIYPKADVALLQRAYDVADERHSGQKRKSGDPYITHPLAVTMILARLATDEPDPVQRLAKIRASMQANGQIQGAPAAPQAAPAPPTTPRWPSAAGPRNTVRSPPA